MRARTCRTSAAGWSAGSTGRRPPSTGSPNAAASPLRFEMDPQGQYNAWKAIEDDGQELLAIYHSHTKSAAYPSQTDVNQAVAWPDPVYVIVSLEDPDAPDVKGYWLKRPEDRRCRARRRVAAGADQGRLRPATRSEAEMIQGLLSEHGIPSMLKRTRGFDIPDFLAAGPRDILVPEAVAEEAREVLEGTPGGGQASRRRPGGPISRR